jgi:hypothetical protein
MYLDLVLVDGLHVYSCLCIYLMHVCLLLILFHALEVEFICFLNSNFRISLLVLSSITKKGEIVAI